MADESIEVEWIATANKMVQVLDRLETKFDKQEKQLQRLSDTGKRGGDAVAGSFNRVEQELKEAEAALKKLDTGTKAFADQKAKVDALRKSFSGMKESISSTGSGITAGLSQGVSTITQMVGGMFTLQTVVEGIVAELDKAKNLGKDAAAQTRTFEQALADLGQNIGAGAVPEARQMVIDQSAKLGTTQEGLANLLGIGISAGAKDLNDAMQLSAAALKLTVGDANRAAALVGGTLDVASLGGSKNYEGALGQLLQTQSQVRSTNLAEFSANIGPGLAAATADLSQQKGVSTERALEMASVISQIIKDQTGSNTATTMRMMFTRMGAFVPEREKKLDDGGIARVSKDQIAQFKSLNTFDERLKMMQEVPGIGQQFLETQRESIGKTAIAEIINRSGRAVQFEDKAKANISSIDKAQSFFAELNDAVIRNTPNLQSQRRFDAAVANTQLAAGAEGQARAIVDTALSKVDLSGIDSFVMKEVDALFASRHGQVSAFQTGEDVLTQLQGQRTLLNSGFIPMGGSMTPEHIALLKQAVDELKRLREQEDLRVRGARIQPAQNVRPKEAPLPAATAP